MNPLVLKRRPVLAGIALLGSLCIGATGLEAQALTLSEAIDAALATHPSVLGARARVDGADAERTAARAPYLPHLSGSSVVSRFAEPMVVAPLHGFDPANPPEFDRTLVQGQLGLDYLLFDGGARGAGLSAAEARGGRARALLDATEMELLEAVTSAYLATLSAREIRDAANRLVAALEAELDRARRRFDEGTAARVEVLRAEAAALDARAQAATAEARVGLAERSLARLTGLDPSGLSVRPVAGLVTRPGAVQPAGVDPRITAAEHSVEAATARLRSERAGRIPTLRASAGLQNFGSGSGDFVTEWQAGVRISWPVFTGGARSAAIRRADAELRAAGEDLRQTELAVGGAIDAAMAARAEAAARALALQASVAQWEEVTRIEALSLETGVGVQQDYLRAEASLFQARAGYARARYDEILAFVGLARARGRLTPDWLDQALEVVP